MFTLLNWVLDIDEHTCLSGCRRYSALLASCNFSACYDRLFQLLRTSYVWNPPSTAAIRKTVHFLPLTIVSKNHHN